MSTSSINTSDAKEEFTEIVNRVSHNKERIILTRRGHPIAVIIPFEDLALLQESQNKNDLEEAVGALKEARQKGAKTLDELKEEIG